MQRSATLLTSLKRPSSLVDKHAAPGIIYSNFDALPYYLCQLLCVPTGFKTDPARVFPSAFRRESECTPTGSKFNACEKESRDLFALEKIAGRRAAARGYSVSKVKCDFEGRSCYVHFGWIFSESRVRVCGK